jgi:hypothetical protein
MATSGGTGLAPPGAPVRGAEAEAARITPRGAPRCTAYATERPPSRDSSEVRRHPHGRPARDLRRELRTVWPLRSGPGRLGGARRIVLRPVRLHGGWPVRHLPGRAPPVDPGAVGRLPPRVRRTPHEVLPTHALPRLARTVRSAIRGHSRHGLERAGDLLALQEVVSAESTQLGGPELLGLLPRDRAALPPALRHVPPMARCTSQQTLAGRAGCVSRAIPDLRKASGSSTSCS